MTTAKCIGACVSVVLVAMMFSGCVAQSELDDANRDLAAAKTEADRSADELAAAGSELAETKVQLTKAQTDAAAATKALDGAEKSFTGKLKRMQGEMDVIAGKVKQLSEALGAAKQQAANAQKVADELKVALGSARALVSDRGDAITDLKAQVAALVAKLEAAQKPAPVPAE